MLTSFYILLGLAPSVIWLIFYLRKDSRPEPKTMVLKIFILGALMGPAAVLLQLAARWLSQPTTEWLPFFAALDKRGGGLFFLNIAVFAPLSEEFLKFLVVRWAVLKNPSFDEPIDAMIYLIISALGFAALENLLNIFFLPELTLNKALNQAVVRFISATLLHTLSSGILGYFLALSLANFKKRALILGEGFLLAVVIHSLYNYFAWLTDFNKFIILPMAGLLAGASIAVLWQFRRLKKRLSVCKI